MPAGIAGGLPIVPRAQAAQFLANGTGIVWVIEPYLPLTAPCGTQRKRTFLLPRDRWFESCSLQW